MKVGDFRLALSARAGGVHFGDGGNEGAVHTPVALDHVLRQRADAGGEVVLPVAITAVRPAAAQLVGLGVHCGVHDLLGESAKQLLHVDGVVVKTGHGDHVRRWV